MVLAKTDYRTQADQAVSRIRLLQHHPRSGLVQANGQAHAGILSYSVSFLSRFFIGTMFLFLVIHAMLLATGPAAPAAWTGARCLRWNGIRTKGHLSR
jgi:hypothetical protein